MAEDFIALRGKLLIASSAILDGHFSQSVVLIVDHDARGSLGLILNHPLPGDRPQKYPLFTGGPVDSDHRSLLHTCDEFATNEPVVDNVYFESSDELIGDLAAQNLPYRRFAGYAGWATGQLEFELRTNSWSVIEGRHELIFHDLGNLLWRRCLVERGGLYRHFSKTHKNILLN